jgi:hypothetical protein
MTNLDNILMILSFVSGLVAYAGIFVGFFCLFDPWAAFFLSMFIVFVTSLLAKAICRGHA